MLKLIITRVASLFSREEATVTVSRERVEIALRSRVTTNAAEQRRSLRFFDSEQVLMGACYVVDGDTIKIRNTRIRLLGIDAPEMDQPYGKKAKWAMHALCKGQIISAHIVGEDAHGRAVGICYLQDGRDLAAELVKQGLALDWSYFSKGKYAGFEPSGIRDVLWRQDRLQQDLNEKSKSRRNFGMPA